MKKTSKTKKLSFNSLALGNLKHRKKQYILLIIGIILSMVFSSGATFFAASALSSAEATKNFTYGKADTIIPFIDSYKDIDKYIEDKYSQVGYAQQFGVLTYKDCELSRGAAIASFDDTAKDFFVDVIEGEYPKNKNEIAIEKEALMRLKVEDSVGVGDTIEFSLYPQNERKLLEKPIKTKFRISGIIASKRVNIENWAFNDYQGLVPAAVVSDDYLAAPGGKAFRTAFAYNNMLMTRAGIINFDADDYYDVMMAQNVSNIELTTYIHWEVWNDVLSLNSPLMFSVILAVVMMIVSNIGIINSFSANLKERKKQIGLLRSVGATKKQIIKLYMREAIVLSLICVPISVPISMAITYLTVPLFGENYVFTPELWVIPVCVVISLIFIWLSALVPLISASRISPMQAIRSVEMQRKLKRKKIKTQKQFDVPSLLAKRNTVLYKSRGALTSLIIAVSIFISTFAFSMMEKQFNDMWYDMESDYYMTAYTGDGIYGGLANFGALEHQISENDVNDVMMNGFVDSVALRKTSKGYIEIDEMTDYIHGLNYVACDYKSYIDNKHLTPENYAEETRNFSADYEYTKKTAGIEKDIIRATVCGFDNETLKYLGNCLSKGDFNLNKIKSGEEVLIFCPKTISLWINNEIHDHPGMPAKTSGINNIINEEDMDYYFDDETNEHIKIGKYENTFKVGQEINLGWLYADEIVSVADNEIDIVSAPDKFEKKINKTKIAGFIDDIGGDKAFYSILECLRYYEGFFVITSNDAINKFCNEAEYDAMEVKLNTECSEEINNNVMKTLEQIGAGAKSKIVSSYQKNKENTESNTATLVMLIAIIAMLFTLSGSLVNNSITARIRESKKSIGTLRAVGASTKELTLSYIKQFIFVLLKGVIGGFGSFFVFIGIWELALRAYEDSIFDDLTITLWQTLLAVLILFISCVINMYSKVKKEMKNSIVENIREL